MTRPSSAKFPVHAILGEAGPGSAPMARRAVRRGHRQGLRPGIANMSKGTWTPKQANDETVKATKDLIVKCLTS